MEKNYLLTGLDCAACATELQTAINKMDGVDDANLNFITGRLTVKGTTVDSQKIKQLIKTMEPEVQVKKANTENTTDSKKSSAKFELIRLALGAVLLIGAVILQPQQQTVALVLYVVALAILGYDVIINAFKHLFAGAVLDENFLMSIATIGAFAIGEYREGVFVMLFYQVGELFQSYAVDKSRRSISSLMDLRPDHANLIDGDKVISVAPEKISVGDMIMIKPGEKVPLDGIVETGNSFLDTSSLTGESLPRSVQPGQEVLSGCINQNGLLTVKVTKLFAESTASKILDLVENAAGRKAKSENFITKFARVYTPIVVGAAVVLAVVPPLVIPGAVFKDWLYRALVFLVISCPCALVISVPLSFFGGIGGASKKGVLVKGGNYLEALAKAETIVFDKTGTLTQGSFSVTEINPVDITADQLLEKAAYAESYSSHPLASSLIKAYGHSVDQSKLTDYHEQAGAGVTVNCAGQRLAVGNAKLLKSLDIKFEASPKAGTVVLVATDNHYDGYIVIGDQVKPDAQAAISQLKQNHIKTVMLTGDTNEAAKTISDQLGLDTYYAQLLPADKVSRVEELSQNNSAKGTLVFVGDGINDAPVLARADVGVAMGALGADAAIEAADVVIMDDQPSKIAFAIRVARKTLRIVKENIVFALGVKAVVLILGALGIAGMGAAVFADVGVAFLAILNAIRMLNVESLVIKK